MEEQIIPQEQPIEINQASPTVSGLSYDDEEILRLKQENIERQQAFDKKREIQRLKQENGRIEAREKEMNKRFNPKFNFTKEKAKFWSIAIVISIAVAVILIKVVQKLF